MPNVVIAIHGGAGTISREEMTPQKEAAYRAALEAALRGGHEVLTRGGTSMDAVTAAVRVMEDSPLFNAGRTLGTYRAAIAQWEQARLQYEQAVLIALREVSDALTALGKLSEAEAAQDTAVRALAAAVGHATDRYRQGLANYFEVLEAQQQLYPAQNTLAQIRLNRLLAYAQLYRALGGGWSLTDPEWAGVQAGASESIR